MRVERSKRSNPFVANAYSATAPPSVVFGRGVRATGFHRLPRSVFWRTSHAMCTALAHICLTAAMSLVSANNTANGVQNRLPAVAGKVPGDAVLASPRISDGYEAKTSEPTADLISVTGLGNRTRHHRPPRFFSSMSIALRCWAAGRSAILPTPKYVRKAARSAFTSSIRASMFAA